ncbi:glutamate formimidoyltransferase [Flavobacteriaceae bacterium F08102]|nr:glutamate formimidoyltransferase [Flavobacteriaceae bacterium F08102]
MQKQLIECVPNISEGRDIKKINAIASVVETVTGVKLLDIDPGKATNRTVITFVGEPQAVVEAAFLLIKTAASCIDMRQHRGEHPRFGATDVCPLVPISGITLEETAVYAHQLGKMVGEQLGIPGYFYEAAAQTDSRKNLANCRSGEYEGLVKKLIDPDWKPDFGPAAFTPEVAKTGAIAISARDFLIAYNVNLNTTSTRRANAIAFDIRESGRIAREGNPITGKKKLDKHGKPIRVPGKLKAVKGIGWYIEEYGIAQISYNLTNIHVTPMHKAFDESCKAAQARGLRVTGSELVGLVPLKAMLDAADYYLTLQQRSLGISEAEKIKIAVKSLGLDDLKPFNPEEKIIEYRLKKGQAKQLIDLNLKEFASITAADTIAPGGGSIAAYVGTLGVSLGTMVANLSAHKAGWDERWEEFSNWAVKGQAFQKKLLYLVDEDTKAFHGIIEGLRMPKGTETEKEVRRKAIEEATKYAIEIPFELMQTAHDSMELMQEMLTKGIPSSLSDGAVGALCARTAVIGGYFNVRINAKGLKDRTYADTMIAKAEKLYQSAIQKEAEVIAYVDSQF